jgi:hypothetical protein
MRLTGEWLVDLAESWPEISAHLQNPSVIIIHKITAAIFLLNGKKIIQSWNAQSKFVLLHTTAAPLTIVQCSPVAL